MSHFLQFLLRGVAIVFSLSLLGAYVWHRQKGARQASDAVTTLDLVPMPGDEAMASTLISGGQFPVPPTDPMLFSTSKSGLVTLESPSDLIVFSSSPDSADGTGGRIHIDSSALAKSALENYHWPEDHDSKANRWALMPGSKSINMPIFKAPLFFRNATGNPERQIDSLIREAESAGKNQSGRVEP